MIQTRAERQAHADAIVAKYASPDYTPRVGFHGQIWTRTHPLRCACGAVFFGFQPEDAPFEPYRSFEPRPGQPGRRPTCCHPLCVEAEDRERFSDACSVRAMRSSEATPQPILVKSQTAQQGRLQPLGAQ